MTVQQILISNSKTHYVCLAQGHTKLPLYKVYTVLVTTVVLVLVRMKNVCLCVREREAVHVCVGGEPIQCC